MDKEYVSIDQNEICIVSLVWFISTLKWTFLSVRSSLDLSELAKAAKKKLQSVSISSGSLHWALCPPFYWSLTTCNFLIFMQLSNHLFEELAMDVYDEVDRRETDAGNEKWQIESCVVSRWYFKTSTGVAAVLASQQDTIDLLSIICSVAGYTESQHPGDGDDCGALPSCESRVFVNKKPGKLALKTSQCQRFTFTLRLDCCRGG